MSFPLPPARSRYPARWDSHARTFRTTVTALVAGAVLHSHRLPAAVPNALPFQGRVSVDGVPFTGNGQFRFALLDAADTVVWSSTPDAQPVDGVPDTPVTLPVNKGLYAVQLGTGMAPILPNLFTLRDNLRLRVWFDDGLHGNQRLVPDQPLAAVGFARHSASADSATTASQATTAGSVTGPIPATQIAGTLANSQLPANVARLDSSPTFTGTVRANYFEGGGAVAWVIASGSTHQAVPNTGILANNGAAPVVITLPTSPRAGDLVRVWGVGNGGWSVEFPAGAALKNPVPPGTHWTPVEENRAWRSIALSADGQRLAAVADRALIYTSADGGKNWSGHASPRRWSSIATSADGQRLAAAARGDSIWTSDDYGATWTSTAPTAEWRQVCSSSDGLTLIAADGTSRLYSSKDGGKTWSATPAGSESWISAAASADGQFLIAGTAGDHYSQTRVSVGTGVAATWSPTYSLSHYHTGPTFVAASASARELAAAVRYSGIWRSSDAGVSWTKRLSFHGLSAIACSGDASQWIASAPKAKLWVSVDSGANWDSQGADGNWSGVGASADGKVLAAVQDGGRIYLSRGQVRGSAESLADFQYLGNGLWTASQPATLSSAGKIPPDRIPYLPAELITSGTIDADRIPAEIRGHRSFPDSLAIGGDIFGADVSDAAPLAVRSDFVNDEFGYCISLHQGPFAVWKMGVSHDDERFSLGAAGRRDDDISVAYSSGNVGLGAKPKSNRKLRVAGDGEFSGTVYCDGIDFFSDSRWKSDIGPIDDALQRIESLRPVTYHWRPDAPVGSNRDRRQIGLIAQEVAPLFPDLVHTNADGFLSVNYVGLTPVLVEAVKELRRESSNHVAEISSLRARLERLESSIPKITTDTPSAAPVR